MRAGRGGGPPRVLEWLLAATVPRGQREAVLGDLHEEYGERATRRGPGAARRWYAREILRSLGPTLWSLRSRLLNPASYTAADIATVMWLALVVAIVAASLVATRLH